MSDEELAAEYLQYARAYEKQYDILVNEAKSFFPKQNYVPMEMAVECYLKYAALHIVPPIRRNVEVKGKSLMHRHSIRSLCSELHRADSAFWVENQDMNTIQGCFYDFRYPKENNEYTMDLKVVLPKETKEDAVLFQKKLSHIGHLCMDLVAERQAEAVKDQKEQLQEES